MISVLIPAFNEADCIAATVQAAWQLEGVSQVIVIDDGSSDQTAETAQQAGALVKRLEQNQGKGAALNAGAALIENEIILLLDADLGATARKAAPLLPPVQKKLADMSIAIFPATGQKAGFGLVKNLACQAIAQWGQGLQVQAPLSGQRALTKQVLQAVLPFAEGYGVEVAMTIKAAQAGFKIIEVPTQLSHKATGRDWQGFKHRGKQYLDVRRTLKKLKKELNLK